MKRFLILIAIVLVGCGESEEAVQETVQEAVQETEDVFVQLSKAIIIGEQEGELLNKLKLITDQQAETIIGAYETKFVTA